MKIDSSGKYLPFRGTCIICPLYIDIADHDTDIPDPEQYARKVRSYHDSLGKALDPKKYSVLPLDSMHMTVRNLWSQASFKSAEEYQAHTLRNMPVLKELQRELSQHSGTIRMRVTGNYAKGVRLDPATYDDGLALANEECMIHLALQKIGTFDRPIRHMTFAYDYDRKLRRTVLSEDVTSILPPVLVFGPPVVCTFDSMLEYVPIGTS